MPKSGLPGIRDDSPGTKTEKPATVTKVHVMMHNGKGEDESWLIDVPVADRDPVAVTRAIRNSDEYRYVWAFYFVDVVIPTVKIEGEGSTLLSQQYSTNRSHIYWPDAKEVDMAEVKKRFGIFSEQRLVAYDLKSMGYRMVLCRTNRVKRMSDGDIILSD
jgi:hypothetical protein